MANIFFSLLFIASLAGVVAFASQSAIPGNPLYPFKIYVNENVDRFMAITATQRATLEAQLADDRLSEMQTLVENGSLSSGAEVQLVNQYDQETDRIKEQISKLEAKGDYAAALLVVTNFRNALASDIAVLTRLHSTVVPHLQASLDEMSTLAASISAEIKK